MGNRRIKKKRKEKKTNLLLGERLALHELGNLLVEAAMGGGRRHLVHAHPLKPALPGTKSNGKTTGKRLIEARNATERRRDGRFDGSGRRIGGRRIEGGRRRRGKPSRPWLRAMAASLFSCLFCFWIFPSYSNLGNGDDFIFSFFIICGGHFLSIIIFL